MKTRPYNQFLLSTLIACLSLMLDYSLSAQIFTNLYNCEPLVSDGNGHSTNSGGNTFEAGVVLSANTLYGTMIWGGSSDNGTVIAVNTDGTGFRVLHTFTSFDANGRNSDGANPHAGLIVSGNTLYGTTVNGGSFGNGTVFAINTDGAGFTNLYSFSSLNASTNSDGANPYASLVLSGTNLYGMAEAGGNFGYGTAFALNTDGTGFRTLHHFLGGHVGDIDGTVPPSGFVLSGNTLYGITQHGGAGQNGTVFAINTDGSGYAILHHFTAHSYSSYTNIDGGEPAAGLMLSGNTLYGTTYYGGSWGVGTVFAINTDGSSFTNLHSFGTGSDGDHPLGVLVMSGNTLYGTTDSYSYQGTAFAMNTDGTGFLNLQIGGLDTFAGMILSGNTLYGASLGAVFSITLPAPPLNINNSGTNVILTWPTYVPGVTLQSTTNLVSPAVWSAVSPAPALVNGQNAVTNPISGSQMFFRLSQ